MTKQLLHPVLVLHLDMGPAKEITGANSETRMIYDVRGGSFDGSGLTGRVLPVVGDWVSVIDGVLTFDVRIPLRTDGGTDIQMSYDRIGALSPPLQTYVDSLSGTENSEHFFGLAPRFEACDPSLDWLTGGATEAVGIRFPDGIDYHIFKV